MPFPDFEVPEGHTAKSVQGVVGGNTFLAVRYTLPDGTTGHDGTCVMTDPFAMIRVTPAVAEAAFLKGAAWLERNPKT